MLRLLTHVLACLLLSAGAFAQGQLRMAGRFAMPGANDATIGAGDATLVMASGSGDVVALSLDLKQQWTVKLPSGVSASPVLSPAGVIIGDDGGAITLLDPATGATRWSFKSDGKIVGRCAFVTVADQPCIIAGSYDTHVYCISPADGKEIWRFKTDAQVHASPLIANSMAIVGGCDGHLRAIGLADGKQKWSTDLGGPIAASPALQGDRIFVATMSGQACAVGLDGRILWRTKLLAEGEQITASPAIAKDLVVFISDGGQLASLKVADGTRLATAKLPGKPSQNLLALDDKIVAGTDDGKVLMIDAGSGRIVDRATIGGSVSTLSRINGKVAACSTEGVLWLLGPAK